MESHGKKNGQHAPTQPAIPANGVAGMLPAAGAARADARVAVVVSRYNESITSNLLEGALAEWSRAHGLAPDSARSADLKPVVADEFGHNGEGGGRRVVGETREGPVVVWVPGAFELVGVTAALARSGRYDGIVALGCVIRGETRHDRYIAGAVADGLAAIAAGTGVAVAFGVLTTQNARQARERSTPVGSLDKKKKQRGHADKARRLGVGDRAGFSNKGVEAMRACWGACEVIRAVREGREAELARLEGEANAGSIEPRAATDAPDDAGATKKKKKKHRGADVPIVLMPDKARAASDRHA